MSDNSNNIADKYDPSSLEKKWKEKWEEDRIFQWDSSKGRAETYSVDTPPPTVSGSLHLGHIFSYTQTDLIARFQRMQGKNIFYPMGWDDNGLPTERRVQNVFGVRCDLALPYNANYTPKRDKGSKDPIDNISRANFIELCSLLTKEDEEVFKNLFQKLGLSVDWSLEYATIDDHCRRASQLSFLDLVKKKEAYSMVAPTLWDVSFQTAVAQAEVEDREHSGFYHDIRFKVEEGGEFIISTTRPELLPACIAVVAHPDDERYKNLFGKFAITPLFHAKVPILAANHADPEKGSGILMVCTFGDTMDIEWWKQSGLPLKQVIGQSGKILEVDYASHPFISLNKQMAQKNYVQLVGLNVKDASKKVVELLSDSSSGWDGKNPALVGGPRPVTRPVKFYEKGDRPLEFISSRQWFVRIMNHKDQLLKKGEEINWQPIHMKARYSDWVRNLNQDWCISRQRYFGVPFPVWYKLRNDGEPDYENPIFAEIDSLPVDPLVDVPKGFKENQRNIPGGFIGEKDVMDTWATSSLTPQIVSHWGQNEKRHQSLFPMDLRPQSHEIIRTWAFYTIVKAYHHEGKIPWRNIAISGWILDPDRKKMSKSKGNVVTPEKYLDEYGGDPIRYWASRARLGADTAFDENLFKIGRKLCNKIFNASKFVLAQLQGQEGEEVSFSFSAGEKNKSDFHYKNITEAIDKAWNNKMRDLVERSTLAFEKNDYALSLQLTEDTFWNFCDHYVEFIKPRSYSLAPENAVARKSALLCLDWSLQTFLRLFAPFFPYLTEEIWAWRYRKTFGKSIHLSSWPQLGEILDFQTLPSSHEKILELSSEAISHIRSFKTKNQKKLKWPVKTLEITTTAEYRKSLELILNDLLLVGNVRPEGVCINVGEISKDQFFVMNIELAEEEEGV